MNAKHAMNWRNVLGLGLLLAALASSWSAWRHRATTEPVGPDESRTDFTLGNFEIVALGKDGKESMTLRAPAMERSRADQTSTLTRPLFLLPDGAGKSAQLMYQDAQGLRITVYLRKPDAPTDAAFRYERQGDVGVFYWVEAGAGYALVGALPKEQLLALAESIYRQHPGAGAASAPK